MEHQPIQPRQPRHLLCERTCEAETMCPCLNEKKAGVAIVVVTKDRDSSGKLDIGEVNEHYGIAFMAVGYSEKELGSEPPLGELFPEGIDKGTPPYRLLKAGTFHHLGKTKDGAVFDLNICDAPGPDCDPPGPNLS